MAEPITWLVLADPDDDLNGGHGDEAKWTIQIAPTPEAAVEKWVGNLSQGFGDDRTFVVYKLDGAERTIIKSFSRWEAAHH